MLRIVIIVSLLLWLLLGDYCSLGISKKNHKLVFMSEIKFNLTLKKKNQIFCFFYAFIYDN